MHKLISIIMPVYNVAPYLEQAIKSVIDNSAVEVELLLIDNGSTDLSGTICNDFKQIDSRIKTFHIPNKGVSFARNYGLDRATGDWIVFIDSDDWFSENAIDKITEMIKNNSDLICFNSFRCVDSGNGETERQPMRNIWCQKRKLNQDDTKRVICSLLAQNYSDNFYAGELIRAVWGKIFKRSIIEQNQIRFPEELTLGEDCVFLIDYIIKADSIEFYNEYLYNYRIRSGSAVNSAPPNLDNQFVWQLEEIIKRLDGIIENNFQIALNIARLGCIQQYIRILRRCNISGIKLEYKLISQLNRAVYNTTPVKLNNNFPFHTREKLAYYLMRYRLGALLTLLY